MAGHPTEPQPNATGGWSPFEWPTEAPEPLPTPWPGADRLFADVAWSRRSAIGESIGLEPVGNLLHHLTKDAGAGLVGRAGIPIQQRITPSAGGLHPYCFMCIGDRDRRVLLYDPATHAFMPLAVPHPDLYELNHREVSAILGSVPGVTVRIVIDADKVFAAYRNPETLILRDAGAILPVVGMLAEWLDLLACPLGFLGSDFVEQMGLPAGRLAAVGGFQISKRRLPV
ncbi:MAG: hypothetical protein IE910_06730 [Brevundimonas sp.]|nr:hypothetical protein [Brevundimonas sp.]